MSADDQHGALSAPCRLLADAQHCDHAAQVAASQDQQSRRSRRVNDVRRRPGQVIVGFAAEDGEGAIESARGKLERKRRDVPTRWSTPTRSQRTTSTGQRARRAACSLTLESTNAAGR